MKTLLLIVALALPPLSRAAAEAVLFIDSSQPDQARLLADINQALFYSPTLRASLSVTVYDINPRPQAFSGEITYRPDAGGSAVARYRPGPLPWLFCQTKGTIRNHLTVSNKEQLCLCLPPN